MNNLLCITQGNTECPVFKLHARGQPITASDVKKVEFAFESEAVVKTYPEAASFDSENGAFRVPLSQTDTFALTVGESSYQIRIYFNDNSVKATPPLPMLVNPAISKVVLS